ncbi:Fanconi anemia group J protein, partial [Rhizopus azygosporus]
AYRAINQALGRCIRHRNDWGAIILLEDRFQTQENVKGLSKWIRSKLQVYDNFQEGISSLKSFVKHRLSIEEESIAREAMDTFAIEEATKGAIETPSVEETTKEAIPIPPTIETTAISSINMADAIEANETPQIDTPNDAKTVKVESINNTLTDNDMDAIMKDIDEDVNCSPPKEEQIIISNFFTKATTT